MWTRGDHVRLMKKNEEKSLLVSIWEWLPKLGWHRKAGCSLEMLLFFVLFSTCASHMHDSKCSMKIFVMTLIWASYVHDEKATFLWFLNVFFCFRPCECMGKHAFTGKNTQHAYAKSLCDNKGKCARIKILWKGQLVYPPIQNAFGSTKGSVWHQINEQDWYTIICFWLLWHKS